MSKKLPLTKNRLHELLAQFDGHVVMEEKGGYDTGVYFSFSGKRKQPTTNDTRIVGGRLFNDYGFCSEDMRPTNFELHGRGGIDAFMIRVRLREAALIRWMQAYPGTAGQMKTNDD